MRLVTTTALALALTAPGYAVLAQDKPAEAKTGDHAAGGAVYMAKAEKTDVFGSDFIGKEIYVKESSQAEARDAARDDMTEANEELAEGQEEASEEMADAQGEGAEERAEAEQEASEEMADARQEAQEDVAEANEEAEDEMAEGPEWESIGEVSDVVMTREGDLKAILVDVGGFLGMGAKTVAITMEELAWQTEEGDDEPFLVLQTDRAALENAPEFDRNPQDDMDRAAVDSADTATAPGALPTATQAMNGTEQAVDDAAEGAEQALNDTGEALEDAGDATAEMASNAAQSVENAAEETGAAIDEATDEAAQETAEATDEATTGVAPVEGKANRLTKMDAAGYREVEAAGLTAETVEGATVYDMGNEDIGEVVDLVLSADGAVDEAIIDVGGFLGLGEHRVAVRMGDLKIMQSDDDPEDLRVYVASTKEELEQMPEVEIDG